MAYISKIKLPSGTTYDLKSDDMINPNLLINPDFKINQRGKTFYSTSACYSVDRWYSYNGHKVKWFGTGIVSYVLNVGVNTWCLSQPIENYESLKGQTVTFSVGYLTDKSCFQIKIYDGVSETTQSLPSNYFTEQSSASVSHTVSNNATQLRVAISVNGQEAEDDEITLYWSKLEIGSVATPFIPPNVAEELPKCLRYYRTLSRGCSAYVCNSSSVVFRSEFEIPMRSNDITVSLLNAVSLTYSSGWVETPSFSDMAIYTTNVTKNGVCYIHVGNFNLTGFAINSHLASATDDFISLDAEMY